MDFWDYVAEKFKDENFDVISIIIMVFIGLSVIFGLAYFPVYTITTLLGLAVYFIYRDYQHHKDKDKK